MVFSMLSDGATKVTSPDLHKRFVSESVSLASLENKHQHRARNHNTNAKGNNETHPLYALVLLALVCHAVIRGSFLCVELAETCHTMAKPVVVPDSSG